MRFQRIKSSFQSLRKRPSGTRIENILIRTQGLIMAGRGCKGPHCISETYGCADRRREMKGGHESSPMEKREHGMRFFEVDFNPIHMSQAITGANKLFVRSSGGNSSCSPRLTMSQAHDPSKGSESGIV